MLQYLKGKFLTRRIMNLPNKINRVFKTISHLVGEIFYFNIFIILLVAIVTSFSCYAEQPTVNPKTYTIKPIPFSGYETTSDINGIPIIFSKHGKAVKTSYSMSEKIVIQGPPSVIKNCLETLSENADKIVQVETQNDAVKDYLTFHGKVPLISKEALLNIVINPREKTFQKNTDIGKIVAKFRSEEFDINGHTKFCLYLTFVYDPGKISIEKIIISAVKLES